MFPFFFNNLQLKELKMGFKKLTFMLANVALLMPNLVNANEIEIQSGDVKIIKNSFGKIYVETDKTSISLPERRYGRRTRRPRRSYYRQNVSCDRGGQATTQYSNQVSSNNSNTVEQSSVIVNCR